MTTKVRRHVFALDESVLRRIVEPGLDLAVWVRRAPSRAKRFTRHCAASLLPNLTFTAPVDQVGGIVLLASFQSPGNALPFAEDVQQLADLFAAATGAKNLRVRLERVEHDGCRLFHMDHVKVRLICTYRGRGTEWLPEHAAMRDGLKKGKNELIVRDPNLVRRMRPWAVALVKGELFTGVPDSGLIHRSPPVVSALEARLVLVIDDADVAYK